MKSGKTSGATENSIKQERQFGFSFAVRTDVGMRRDENQDAYGLAQTKDVSLFIVTDGMGGASGGARASFAAANLLARLAIDQAGKITPKSFHNSITQANKFIYNESQTDENLAGMGTTLVMVGVVGDKALIANVGDSRIYLKRDRNISQLTKDHTLVQQLVELGEISADQAESHPMAHMLTRSLGPMDHIEADIGFLDFKLEEGDTFILCCDGLYNHVADFEIAEIVNDNPPGEAAEELVKLANGRGGSDNITVEVVTVTNIKDTPKSCAFPNKENRIEVATSGETKKFKAAECKHEFKEVVVKVHDKFTSSVDSVSASAKPLPSSLDVIKGTETKPSVMTDGSKAFDSIILGQIPKESKAQESVAQEAKQTSESGFNVLEKIPVTNFSEENLVSGEGLDFIAAPSQITKPQPVKSEQEVPKISKEAPKEVVPEPIKSEESKPAEVKAVDEKVEQVVDKPQPAKKETIKEPLIVKEKPQISQTSQLTPLSTNSKDDELEDIFEKKIEVSKTETLKPPAPEPAVQASLDKPKVEKPKPAAPKTNLTKREAPKVETAPDLKVQDISYLEEYSESFPTETSSKSSFFVNMFGILAVFLGLGGGFYFLKDNPTLLSRLEGVKKQDWFASFNSSEVPQLSQPDRVVSNEEVRSEIKKASNSVIVNKSPYLNAKKKLTTEPPKAEEPTAQVKSKNDFSISLPEEKVIGLKDKEESSAAEKNELTDSDFKLASKMDKDDPLLKILENEKEHQDGLKKEQVKPKQEIKSEIKVPEVKVQKKEPKIAKTSKVATIKKTNSSDVLIDSTRHRKVFLKKSRIRDKIDAIDGKLHSYKVVSKDDLKKKQESIEEQIPIINESIRDTKRSLKVSKRKYSKLLDKKTELQKGNIAKIARDAARKNSEIRKFSQDWQKVSLKYRNTSEKNMRDSSYSAQMAKLGKEIKLKKDRLKKALAVFMDSEINGVVQEISDDGISLQNLEKRKKLLARQVSIAKNAKNVSPEKRKAAEKKLQDQRASLMIELTVLNKQLSDEQEESLKRKKILRSHGVN